MCWTARSLISVMVARHRGEQHFLTARSIVKNYFDHTAIVVVMVVAVL
jgi:hypothetical protein